MAFTPISNDFIQYQATASGTSAAAYFLKLYAAGTTTPISAALDSAGSILVAKVELDSQGFAKNGSGGPTTVYIDQTYRLVLYTNATDADANTFANAVQNVDDILQLSTTEDADAIEAEVTAITNVTVNYDYVDGMASETAPIAERVVKLKDYSLGGGAGVLAFITKAATGTDDGGAIINHDTLAFRYEQIFDESIDAARFGIDGTGDETTKLQSFLTYITSNSIHATIKANTYTFSDNLISTSDAVDIYLECDNGKAVFNYTGVEISSAIKLNNVGNVDIVSLTFEMNDLCVIPIDIRRTFGNFGGYCNVDDITVKNTKSSAIVADPIAIFLSGPWANTTVRRCFVDGVSYLTADRAAAGIGLTGQAGNVEVSGNTVKNLLFLGSNGGANGIDVFGTDAGDITVSLGAQVSIFNNTLVNCLGRGIKLQVSNAEVHGNQIILSDGVTTRTAFKGIDVQSDNGDIHSNTFRFGSGITFGAGGANSVFTLQNIRNDGDTRSTFCYNNRILSNSQMDTVFSLVSQFGTSSFSLEGNTYSGSPVARACKFAVKDLDYVNIDHISIAMRNNKFTHIIGELFDQSTNVDMGDTLFLELTDNENLEMDNADLYDEGQTSFSVNHNFRIRDNIGIKQRVNWVFDMDDLPSGNAFFTGGQTVLNQSPNTGSTFFHVITDGYVQRNIIGSGTAEDRRTSFDGITWNSWVAV